MFYDLFDTPAGAMIVVQDELGVRYIDFQEGAKPLAIVDEWQHSEAFCREAREQILSYFAGTLTQFDLPLAPEGTEFQQRVWAELAKVPFGETRSYGDLASALGQPTASRAVGMANGRNPLSIVLPCHRVVGSSKKLTGYRGGLKIKEQLLRHENIGVKGGQISP